MHFVQFKIIIIIIINHNFTVSQGGNKIKKENSVNTKKLNTVPEYKGDKSIEEILDFIEGTKNRNTKRTAKKLRRKQRQVCTFLSNLKILFFDCCAV